MSLPKTIDLQSFEVKDELAPDIWDGDMLNSAVRDRLLEIAKTFVDWLGIDVPVYDITFTGSLANYNWSKYSDIDLHVLINYSDVDEDIDLVRDLMSSKKSIWNDRFDIEIKDYPVELYAQDANEPHHSTGVYSVLRDEWVVKPRYEKPQVDLGDVREKATAIMNLIDDALDGKCSYECLGKVKDKIKNMRQAGLESGGEYSVENLAFKALRRNGWLELLYDEADDRLVDELTLESHDQRGITQAELQQIEAYADRLFAKVDIDVEFTSHFVERVNDERNVKPITPAELTRLFKQSYKRYGKKIPKLGPGAEAVLHDMRTDVNMPFILKWDPRTKMLDLVAKTVMRKKNFSTPDPKLSVESAYNDWVKKRGWAPKDDDIKSNYTLYIYYPEEAILHFHKFQDARDHAPRFGEWQIMDSDGCVVCEPTRLYDSNHED